MDGPSNRDGAIEPSAVTVSNLRADWATPNWISWRWDATGGGDLFSHYELLVSSTGITSGSWRLPAGREGRIWTAADNPELGGFVLGTEAGDDKVLWTRTHGHEPDRQYSAQLRATDKQGRRSLSNVAFQRTTAASTKELVILSEDKTAGSSLPPEFLRVDGAPYQGTFHYEYEVSCPDPQVRCGDHLRRQNLEIALGGLGEQDYLTTAFFEVALASSKPTVSWWAQVWIRYQSGDIARIQGWTIRLDTSYLVVQFPLRLLHEDSKALPFAAVSTGIDEVNFFGREVDDGVKIRVDEARIRW